MIAEYYGVGKSMILDIKKYRDKILLFKLEMCNMGMRKKAKVMKVGDGEQHDIPKAEDLARVAMKVNVCTVCMYLHGI